MTQQLDLIDYMSQMSRYPHAPAEGKTDTSRAAASGLAPGRCEEIRLMMLDLLRDIGPMTYKDVCSHLETTHGIPERTSQPRWTELKKQQRIRDTGRRRDKCAVMEVGNV